MILASSNVRQGHVRTGHLRGFTLIELLVVIAIIGILSAVVLASLNTARNKGADAAIKSNIDSARAQAELYYDANSNSYANVCTGSAGGVSGIAAMVAGTQSAGGTVFCNSSATAWVLSSTLKTASTSSWCVDSTGTSTTRTGNPTGTNC
jgi:prepilin-type N-terminal cleavage/methylation domain-containing protein